MCVGVAAEMQCLRTCSTDTRVLELIFLLHHKSLSVALLFVEMKDGRIYGMTVYVQLSSCDKIHTVFKCKPDFFQLFIVQKCLSV